MGRSMHGYWFALVLVVLGGTQWTSCTSNLFFLVSLATVVIINSVSGKLPQALYPWRFVLSSVSFYLCICWFYQPILDYFTGSGAAMRLPLCRRRGTIRRKIPYEFNMILGYNHIKVCNFGLVVLPSDDFLTFFKILKYELLPIV